MSIRPISFCSTKVSKSTSLTKEQQRIRHMNNPFRNSDLIPLSVCCGIGFMAIYAAKSGKLQSIKKAINLA